MSGFSSLMGIPQTLTHLATAPVARWQQTGVLHKIFSVGVGAGLAYYFHQKGMSDLTVAAIGLGSSYGASMLLHSSTILREQQTPVATVVAPSQVDAMAQQADRVLSGISGGGMGSLPSSRYVSAPSAMSPATASSVSHPPMPISSPQTRVAPSNSRWSLLSE
jgi:hypothetical protein